MLEGFLTVLLKNLIYVGNFFSNCSSNNDNNLKIITDIFEYLP